MSNSRVRPHPPDGDVAKAEAKIDSYLAYAKEKLPIRARRAEVRLIDDFIMAVREEVYPWTHYGEKSIDGLAATRSRQMRVFETQRRCDRAIVVAIRAAQRKGLMAKRGDSRGEFELTTRDLRSSSPAHEVWPLADISDGAFEVTLNRCREQHIMTRAAMFRALAGNEQVKIEKVRPRRVKITDAATQRRAYEGAITVMAGLADGLRNIGETHSSISEGEREKWLHELVKHRSVLTTAMNHLQTAEWRARKAQIGRSAVVTRLYSSRANRKSPV